MLSFTDNNQAKRTGKNPEEKEREVAKKKNYIRVIFMFFFSFFLVFSGEVEFMHGGCIAFLSHVPPRRRRRRRRRRRSTVVLFMTCSKNPYPPFDS